MVQILAAGVTATLAGLGWLISRWLQRDALVERMNLRLKLVALHQRMKQAGLSMQELQRMERELSGGNVSAARPKLGKRCMHIWAVVHPKKLEGD